MRVRPLAPLLLAAGLGVGVLGCDEPAPSPPPPPPPREEPQPPPAPEPPAPPACPLGEVLDLGEAWESAATLALALGDDGGVLAVADGAAVRVRDLDPAGAVRGEPRELALAGALLALEPMGDDALVVTRGPCTESAHCLLARLSRGDTLLSAPLPGALVTTRRARVDGRLYLAWTAAGGHRGLELYLTPTAAPGADPGFGRVRRPLGREPADDELPAEVLGLAADGEHWAALWRRGAGEDERSRVFLTTDTSHRAIPALHEALVVEAMRFDGARAELVVGFEMSRPHFIALTPRADEPAEAHELAPSEVPPPFAEHVRATLVIDEGLHLERANAAGDPIGERVTVVAETPRAAAVARREGEHLVAWLDGAGAPHARWVRCER